MSPRIRSFIAIDPSPAMQAAMTRLVAECAATGADVRWLRAAGLHCTLKFLGPVEESRLEGAHRALAAALVESPAVAITGRGTGVFPSPRRPRVVWIGLEGEGLTALAETIERALEGLGFEREHRGFTPHITLGRVNSRRGWEQVAAVMAAHAGLDFGSTVITEVVIYRSDLRREGAVYTPLWTIPLRASSVAGA